MITPMICTPQVTIRIDCAGCGALVEHHTAGFLSAQARCDRMDAEGWACPNCDGKEPRISVAVAMLPDPIATVRQVHPRAFALPPGALCGQWSIIPHANSSPLDWPMAKGDTEAAAWLAAAERVCA